MRRVKPSLIKILLSLSLWFFFSFFDKSINAKGQVGFGQHYDSLTQNHQLLNAPLVVFLQQKKMIVFQTLELYRGIDTKNPLKRTITQFIRNQNNSWESSSVLLSDGVNDLTLIGQNSRSDILLFTDSKTRSCLYLLELNNKRTPMAKPIENFNNGGFPIHSATLNQAGDQIIFSSARLGTKGGYDLFIAELTSGRRVAQLKNAGRKVNTPFDEIFPQFSDDDTRLRFATNFAPSPSNFQTIEAQYTNGQITPVSIYVPTDTLVKSVCQIQVIDSALTLVTTFDPNHGFSHRFVFEKISTIPYNQNLIIEELKDPRWRKIRLQGYIKAPNTHPIEVCLLDTFGNVIASTTSQASTWSFSHAPESKFFISFSSTEIYPLMYYFEIPAEYPYPVYVFDISAEERKHLSASYTTVFDPLGLSPLQYFEIKPYFDQNPTDVALTLIINQKTNSLNFKTFQIPSIAIPNINFAIKPLFTSYASSLNTEQNGCLLIELKQKPYPNYTVKPWQSATSSINSANQYTVIVGNTTETDPYSLIKFAMANENSSVFYNQGSEKEYCLGTFTNINQAINMLKTIRKNGHPDAMLGMFDPKENRYVKIPENTTILKKYNSQNNSAFWVEVYSSTTLIQPKTFPYSEKLRLVVDGNGVFHYIYEVETIAHANNLISELKRHGYNNVAIVSIESEDVK